MADEDKHQTKNNNSDPEKPLKPDELVRVVRESVLKELIPDNEVVETSVEVPHSFQDTSTYQQFSLYQLIYPLSGLVLGLVCIIGGIFLFLNGVVGSTSWTANIPRSGKQHLGRCPRRLFCSS